nr:hypothetical protein HK105_007732 [Polyrhizophydium stewartii]
MNTKPSAPTAAAAQTVADASAGAAGADAKATPADAARRRPTQRFVASRYKQAVTPAVAPPAERPAAATTPARLLLSARLIQIQAIQCQVDNAFIPQAAAAESQLKRAAAHVMYLQSEISKMRHHASVRQQLTDSIKMLKQQHASTQKVDMHLAQFVRNYKLLLSTIQTASKLVRLNGVSATNEGQPPALTTR